MNKQDAQHAKGLDAALAHLVADYKACLPPEQRRPTDNEIRGIAKHYGVDACELYALFNTALAGMAAKGAK